jgi:Mannitol dehydrogenase Rossmann domain
MSPPQLSLASLDHIAHTGAGAHRTWTGPAIDPRSIQVGIVHLGIGAFHRAYQAVLTELAAAASGRDDWGITGVTQRSTRVRDQLMAQDGLYSIVERGSGAAPLRVVGSVREVRMPGRPRRCGRPDRRPGRPDRHAHRVGMLDITEIFGTDLREHDGFRAELAAQVARLSADW